MLAFKMSKKATRVAEYRQPSWISFRLGRLGMNKAILVSRYGTAGSGKDHFISDFGRDSSVQETFPLDFYLC